MLIVSRIRRIRTLTARWDLRIWRYPVNFLMGLLYFTLWPLVSLIYHAIDCIKYENADVSSRVDMEEKVRESSRVTGRAQLVEVCIESTFN